MTSFAIHTCNFFNIFIHGNDYAIINKTATLAIYACHQDPKIILAAPIQSGMTPGFIVPLQTQIGHAYLLEVNAIMIEGDESFIMIEDQSGTRIVPRTNKFCCCGENLYYIIEFQAISTKTNVGILFNNNTVDNKLQIHQFRIAPYLDVNNLVNENLTHWKCITGQFGQPLGCTGCEPANTNQAIELFAGPTGPRGEIGLPGPQGIDGLSITGPTGNTGPQGPQGISGDIGNDGPPGPQGPQGPTGPQGSIGPPGVQGPVGDTGPPGPIGLQGPQGERGIPGAPGDIGAPGTGAIIGVWTTTWNRNEGGSTAISNINYQLIGNFVGIFIPEITFDVPTTSITLQTTVDIPIIIRPASTTILTQIVSDSGIGKLVRVKITPTTVIFSSTLEDDIPYGLTSITLYGMTLTYYLF